MTERNSAAADSLPQSWNWVALSELGNWTGGGTPSKDNASYWTDGAIPWVSPKDMKSALIYDTEDHITEEAVAASATQEVQPGTVLMVTRSGILRRTFPVAVLAVPATMNQDLKGLTPHFGIDPRFVAQSMRRFERDILDTCAKDGTTVQSIEFSALKRFRIALAPTAEQTRIADALDELLSDLDAGIASLERAKARLGLYRAAVLKAAVEGDLTSDWRAAHPEVEPADRLLERMLEERRRRWEVSQLEKFAAHARTPPENWRSKYRAPAEPNKSELPALPDGWCWATVEQLIVEPIVNGVSVRGTTEPPGIASLRLDAMSDSAFNYEARRYLPLNESEVDDLWIEEGDFFVSRGNGSKKLVGRGTLAQAPLMKVICPDLMMRLRLCSELRTTQWLARIWNSPVVRAQIEAVAKTTAGIYKVPQPDVARIAIPLPPSDEQVALVEAIDHQLSTLDHLAADIDTRLASAAALRQSILREAFAGRLVPQDPDDEPAAVLLERIAAERGSRSERRGDNRRQARAEQMQRRDTGTRTDG